MVNKKEKRTDLSQQKKEEFEEKIKEVPEGRWSKNPFNPTSRYYAGEPLFSNLFSKALPVFAGTMVHPFIV